MNYNDVLAAAERIAPFLAQTPLLVSRIGEERKLDLRLKPECRQVTSSFKVRGAANKIMRLSDAQRAAGVVTASSGNHGLAVAYLAGLLGIPATVVVPENANPVKVAGARACGASIIVHGHESAERRKKAAAISCETGAVFIHSHDDLDIIAGQGTVAAEIVADWPAVEAIVAPVGGGGLIAGISLIKQIHPSLVVIGVQPAGSAGAALSFRKGEITSFPQVATVADGLRASRPGESNFAIIRKYVDDIVTVNDDDILAAMFTLLERDKILAEPSGATPLAAVLAGRLPARLGRIAAVISGGNIAVPSLCALLSADRALKNGQTREKE